MTKVIKIGVLTSSRADYGIYRSLLVKIKKDSRFDLEIIAFGMHLESKHGSTIKEIESDNYKKIVRVQGMPANDSKLEISKGYGNLISSFSSFWCENKYDLVLALGDRFEMSAAVQAGIVFEINFAHFHGGETSLGSLDNIYRDQISLASKIHFTSTSESTFKLEKLLNKKNHIYNIGSLSLDGIENLRLPKWTEVCKEFKIPNERFVLVTFHPETVKSENNIVYLKELKTLLLELSNEIHLVITMPNADLLGNLYRKLFIELNSLNPKGISLIDSFGKLRYFSAMKNCDFLLGNSSSGIIEAATFKKFFINVGNRQNGRVRNKNVIDVPFNKLKILDSIKKIRGSEYKGPNKYKKDSSSELAVEIIIKNC